MNLKAQHVFGRLEPYRIVADLKCDLQENNGRFFTPHPVDPESLLYVGEHEFISMRRRCDFVAGGIFDFLAVKLEGYEQAVDYVLDRYGAAIQSGLPVNLTQHRDTFVSQLKLDRKRFSDLIALRMNLASGSPIVQDARAWLLAKQLNVNHCWKIIYAAKGWELNRLLNMTSGSDNYCPDSTYVIFPFFSDYHTFDSLQIHSVAGDRVTREDFETESRFGFFGLHSHLPGSRPAHCHASYMEAASALSAGLSADNQGCLFVRYNLVGAAAPLKIESGLALVEGNTPIDDLVKTRLAFSNFRVADSRCLPTTHQAASVEWHDYVVSRFYSMFAFDKCVSPRIRAFIESIRIDDYACQVLLRWLSTTGQYPVVEEISRIINYNQEFERPNGLRILETDRGYVAKKAGKPGEMLITNYLYKVDQNIWFEETKELFHSCRVLLAKKEYPCMLSQKLLGRPAELTLAARSAVFSTDPGGHGILPTVLDTSFQGHLAAVMNQQVANRPRTIGVKQLGWDATKNQFITPVWQAKTHGVEPTSKVKYPGSELLDRFFSFQDYPCVVGFGEVPLQAKSLIAMVVASICRTFLGKETKIVRCQNGPQLLAILEGIFQALGQSKIIELNSNNRPRSGLIDPAFLSGYPIMGNCENESLLNGITYPIFLLGKTGLEFDGNLSVDAYKQIYSMALVVLQQTTAGILRDRLENFELHPEVTDAALIAEGRSVIERYSQFPDFPVLEDDLPNFRAVLSSIPFPELSKYFQFDLTAQSVQMNCRKFEVQRRTLYEEFSKYTRADYLSSHYLSIDPTWIKNQLEDFYKQPVTFAQKAPAATLDVGLDSPLTSEIS